MNINILIWGVAVPVSLGCLIASMTMDPKTATAEDSRPCAEFVLGHEVHWTDPKTGIERYIQSPAMPTPEANEIVCRNTKVVWEIHHIIGDLGTKRGILRNFISKENFLF